MNKLKQAQSGKGTKAQRGIKNSVPVCLCAYVPDKKGLAPLEITRPWASVKSLTGFSFMELMVVIAIVALLVAASMPAFRNYTRGKNLKEGTNIVISALRKTRNAAITERKRYRTVFDTVNNAVAIYLSGDDDNPAENWRGLSEFVEFDTTPLALGGNWVVSNTYDVPFDYIYYLEFKTSGGLSTGAIDQTIVLIEQSTTDTKAIRVNALTGRINVE